MFLLPACIPAPFPVEENPRPFFLASMEAMDHELGRLLDAIDSSTRENTLILLLSENGSDPETIQSPYTPEHAKQTLYQGGINIPFVISGLRVTRRGERERALVNTVDLFATIAAMAGTGVTAIHDSHSLQPLLSNRAAPTRIFAYADCFGPTAIPENVGWTLRDSSYKVIVFEDGSRQLFDLQGDPFERRDLLAGGGSQEARRIAARLISQGEELRGSADRSP